MSLYPQDYMEYVIEDIKKNGAGRKIKKAGIFERYLKKKCFTKKMHANPEDEFSQEKIGPNFEIIGNYGKEIRNCLDHNLPIYEEPIVVEKLETDGYMILNGHHRWFAALRMGIKRVVVQIVNLVHAEDLNRMIDNTSNYKRVAFDFDEVLLTDNSDEQEPVKDSYLSRRMNERLRKGVKEVFSAFKENGYDVWVYTAGYRTEEYIKYLFSLYNISPDGVVNGVNDNIRRNPDEIQRIKTMLKEKYKYALHVDNDSILCIDTEGKSFDQYSLDENGKDWAEGIVSLIPKLNNATQVS